MRQKKSFGQRAEEFLGGKGFYIVLFVCVAVIGVSAWLLLFSQYSPLMPDDAGDYLDAMGDIDMPGPADDPSEPVIGNAGENEPEHEPPAPDTGKLTQEPNKPEENKGALVIDKGEDKDKDEGKDKDSEKDPGKAEGPEESGGKNEAAMKPEDLSFIWPLAGEVTMGYSPDELVYSSTMGDWRVHDGIDLAVELGTKVLSAASGTVTRVEDTDTMGTTVEIDHGAGVTTTYANLAGTPTVKPGDSVTMGSVIGSVGSTALYETGDAAHLHFSMSVNGESVDPNKYLP